MLAWLAAPAWAGAIQDPAAWIDPGGGSAPFNGSASLDPSDNVIYFYNNTGNVLTSISLTTTLNTDLSPDEISQFNCGSSIFLDCAITYNPGTGELTMDFSDLPPSGGDFTPDDMGIPLGGHFVIDFFNVDGNPDSGNGWDNGNTTLFPGGNTPVLDATSTAPEPGTSTLLAAGLLSLAWLSRRNYFSRSSRS